jgi:hypothetical protein
MRWLDESIGGALFPSSVSPSEERKPLGRDEESSVVEDERAILGWCLCYCEGRSGEDKTCQEKGGEDAHRNLQEFFFIYGSDTTQSRKWGRPAIGHK